MKFEGKFVWLVLSKPEEFLTVTFISELKVVCKNAEILDYIRIQNTRESIGKEFEVEPYLENNVFLEMPDKERERYDGISIFFKSRKIS